MLGNKKNPMNPTTTNSPPAKPQSKFSPITSLVFLVALGIAIWLDFAELWPVTKLMEIQQNLFGGYYVKFTFFLTLMIVWLPLFAIEKIITKLILKK
jgi:hypothetical protein